MSTYILIYLTMLKIILKIRMSTLHKSSNLVNNHYVSQQSSRSITSSQKDSIFWKGLLGLNGTPPHCDLCISLQGSNNNILVCLTRNVVGLVNCKGSQTQWPRNFFDLERVICSPPKTYRTERMLCAFGIDYPSLNIIIQIASNFPFSSHELDREKKSIDRQVLFNSDILLPLTPNSLFDSSSVAVSKMLCNILPRMSIFPIHLKRVLCCLSPSSPIFAFLSIWNERAFAKQISLIKMNHPRVNVPAPEFGFCCPFS